MEQNKDRLKWLEQPPSVEDFMRLRQISGLTPRPRIAVEKGLPNSLYAIHAHEGEQAIAMGRVVGDGGMNFEIVDIAVDPKWQGQGLGRDIMATIMEYLQSNAPTGAYVTLMADVPALYEKFGFQLSRPRSEGMYLLMP